MLIIMQICVLKACCEAQTVQEASQRQPLCLPAACLLCKQRGVTRTEKYVRPDLPFMAEECVNHITHTGMWCTYAPDPPAPTHKNKSVCTAQCQNNT